MSTAPKVLDIGPIRVSGNGRYFVDQNNRPFFWLGDTQWQLFRNFTIAEAETILENRRSKGFTAIQVMLTGVGDGTKPNLTSQTPWINNNPDNPNEDYFKHVDSVYHQEEFNDPSICRTRRTPCAFQ